MANKTAIRKTFNSWLKQFPKSTDFYAFRTDTLFQANTEEEYNK